MLFSYSCSQKQALKRSSMRSHALPGGSGIQCCGASGMPVTVRPSTARLLSRHLGDSRQNVRLGTKRTCKPR
jgi:hypothetical protein